MILRYINSIFTFTCQHVHKSISVDNFLLLTQFCYHLMWLQNLENCSWKLWVNYWRRLHCWTFQRWLIVHLALRLSAVKLCSDVMTCSQTSSGWSEIIKPIMCLWSIGGGVILIHSLFSLANLFCMLARKLPEVGTFWNNWCFVRLMPFLLPYQLYHRIKPETQPFPFCIPCYSFNEHFCHSTDGILQQNYQRSYRSVKTGKSRGISVVRERLGKYFFLEKSGKIKNWCNEMSDFQALNLILAGAPPHTPLGEITALPILPSCT